MAIRSTRLGSRAALLLLGVILTLQAAASLQKGEPDYRSHYNQPVSAHVVLVLGAALVVWALLPWPRRWPARGEERPRPRIASRTSAGRPGRNDLCPCGSGRKYKRCCRARDDERRRAESVRRRRAALNRANGATSVTAVVNRGLSGW
jgi:hypothetical protein